MASSTKTPADELVACEVCLKEIPVSETKSEEATEYVVHFCGLDCYEKWKQQKTQKEK